MVIRDTRFQDDIRVLRLTRQFAVGVYFFVALAIVDGIRSSIQTRCFAESGALNSIDLKFEVITTIRIFPISSWHFLPASLQVLVGSDWTRDSDSTCILNQTNDNKFVWIHRRKTNFGNNAT